MLRINVIGGLGNQMYQYAFCRSVSEQLGYKFYVSNIGKNYHFGNENRKNNNNSLFDIFDLECGVEDGSGIASGDARGHDRKDDGEHSGRREAMARVLDS